MRWNTLRAVGDGRALRRDELRLGRSRCPSPGCGRAGCCGRRDRPLERRRVGHVERLRPAEAVGPAAPRTRPPGSSGSRGPGRGSGRPRSPRRPSWRGGWRRLRPADESRPGLNTSFRFGNSPWSRRTIGHGVVGGHAVGDDHLESVAREVLREQRPQGALDRPGLVPHRDDDETDMRGRSADAGSEPERRDRMSRQSAAMLAASGSGPVAHSVGMRGLRW